MAGARHKERRRLGGWLPQKEDALADFRRTLRDQAFQQKGDRPSTPVVRDLAALVGGDPVLRMDLRRAIDDATEAGYELGYTSIDELMVLIDYLMTYAPPFSDSGLVVCPLNALLEWPMCMPSGYAVFRDAAFNAQLRRILNTWCGFLSGPYSRTHLNADSPNGWFCEKALAEIGMDQFVHDRRQPYWGFASWNAFFTRQLKPGVRPVAEPRDDRVIVNACEASPYNLQHDLKLRDDFWMKSQPHSLVDIFTDTHRDLAERYVGGSLYQAYLSSHNYHRWHAPISGTIERAYFVDGTYYSALEAEGEDSAGLNDSQGYSTAVAARAIIVIAADHAPLGRVACVFVGMAEVSSCVIEALPGQHVSKGDEIGFFQYGGSTYCLVFEPDAVGDFVPKPPFDDTVPPLKINTELARAR